MHMLGLDGQDHWQQGIFREIVPPERIVRTYCWTDAQGRPMLPETLLTVTFDGLAGRTELTVDQAVFDRPMRGTYIRAAGAVLSTNSLTTLQKVLE